VTWLLGDALAVLRKNMAMAREIEQGNDISEIAAKHKISPIASALEPNIAPKWWLESTFEKMRLTFAKGILLIYGITVMPTVFFLPFVLQTANTDFQLIYCATIVGCIEIFIILIPLRIVNTGLRKLSNKIRKGLSLRYVAPATLLRKEDLELFENLKKTDDNFRDSYIKPIIFKTFHFGYELSFKKRYQVAAGAICLGIYSSITFLRSALHSAPPTVLEFPTPLAAPEIAVAWTVYAFLVNGIAWFLVGMFAWSLFVVFAVILQTSSQTIEIRSFESIRELFRPITDLVLKTSFAVALLVTWACAFTIAIGMIPPAPIVREVTATSVEFMLAFMIPVIALSLFIPFFAIHKGMVRTRERALFIKRYKLEKLKESNLKDLDKRLKIQTHLINDYTLILENPEWMLGSSQLLQVFGTLFLPIIVFFLGQL
jgi:hypothetical protein